MKSPINVCCWENSIISTITINWRNVGIVRVGRSHILTRIFIQGIIQFCLWDGDCNDSNVPKKIWRTLTNEHHSLKIPFTQYVISYLYHFCNKFQCLVISFLTICVSLRNLCLFAFKSLNIICGLISFKSLSYKLVQQKYFYNYSIRTNSTYIFSSCIR